MSSGEADVGKSLSPFPAVGETKVNSAELHLGPVKSEMKWKKEVLVAEVLKRFAEKPNPYMPYEYDCIVWEATRECSERWRKPLSTRCHIAPKLNACEYEYKYGDSFSSGSLYGSSDEEDEDSDDVDTDEDAAGEDDTDEDPAGEGDTDGVAAGEDGNPK